MPRGKISDASIISALQRLWIRNPENVWTTELKKELVRSCGCTLAGAHLAIDRAHKKGVIEKCFPRGDKHKKYLVFLPGLITTKTHLLTKAVPKAAAPIGLDGYGPEKDIARVDKWAAVLKVEGGIQNFFSLPGIGLAYPGNLEQLISANYPEAYYLGVEKDEEIFKKIQFSPYAPMNADIKHGNLKEWLENSNKEFQFGDLDFCGQFEQEERDSFQAAVRRISCGGVLALTVAKDSRAAGNYQGYWGSAEPTNILLQHLMRRAAWSEHTKLDLLLIRSYNSHRNGSGKGYPMLLFLFQVKKMGKLQGENHDQEAEAG